jgi:hypothetical protein
MTALSLPELEANCARITRIPLSKAGFYSRLPREPSGTGFGMQLVEWEKEVE